MTRDGSTATPYLLELRGISKRFGSVEALKDVYLELGRGEILGLVGDNGAGKSTLLKVLTGAVIPDQGQILLESSPITIHSALDARAAGIEMVYQDLAIFDNLDVAANIFIGRELVTRTLGIPRLDKRRMWAEAETILARLKINIASPRLLVERMSGGQRQMVACAKAMAFDSKILLMDEPTAALGVREANALLEQVESFKGSHSIIWITQRIPDVLRIADRVMILKGGQRQDLLKVKDVTLDDIVELIVRGRPSEEASKAEEIRYRSFG